MSVFSLQHKAPAEKFPLPFSGPYSGRSETGLLAERAALEWAGLRDRARLPAFLLFVTTVLFFSLRFAGIAIEDLQTFLFPLFLGSFLLLFRGLSSRFLGLAVAATVLIWAVGALHVRGYLGPKSGAAYFARLNDDPTGLVGRGVMLRVNHIANTYNLSDLVPLQRMFNGRQSARRWIDQQPESPALVAGTNEIFQIFVSSHFDQSIDRLLSRFRRAPLSRADEIQQLAVKYDFDTSRDGVEIALPGSDTALILVSAPEIITVPGRPVEMNRHYLAWLLNGVLRLSETEAGPALRQLGLKKKDLLPDLARLPAATDAFNEASRIVGDWPTPLPMITSRFFLATLNLIEGIDGRFEEGPIRQADDLYRSATGFARRELNDPVVAALWNNRAVARLLLSSEENDLREVKRWLLRAAAITDSAGNPVLGARAAMINLIMLERSGF